LKNKLVSVVVTCYNSEDYIAKAIKSVLSQTYDSVECIVVDDGSTDNSQAVIRSMVEKDARIKSFRKENGGAGSARNFGIEKSNGEWFQVLDGDDWLHPEKIENQITAIKLRDIKKDEYVIVYSDWKVIYEEDYQGSNNDTVFTFQPLSKNEILKILVGRKFGFSTPIPINVNNTLLSKNIFNQVRYNEEMPNVMDLDFFYRVLQLECKIIYVPGVSMSYRQHSEGISKQDIRSLIGYTMFIENIMNDDVSWLNYFPNIKVMLERAILNDLDDIYHRLVSILKKSEVPVYLSVFGMDINIRSFSIFLLNRGYFLKFMKINIVLKRKMKKFEKRLGLIN
jgi:glycosyltransferase involved in cell wall biosynthesis